MREGWRGMVEQLFQPLGPQRDLGDPAARRHDRRHARARTRTSSTAASTRCARTFEQLDALVAIGGEDTLGVAAKLFAEFGLPVVGVPKTIDNDLSGTDYTFGFDTAVAICTEAIDRLHTTAESHNRVMVVEVMGRHAGWIAVHERHRRRRRRDPDPRAARRPRRGLRARSGAGTRRGKNFSIVVVSEGCELPGAEDKGEVDQFGHKLLAKRGVGEQLGERDREPHRLRDARHGARPRPARRLADRPRPRSSRRASG